MANKTLFQSIVGKLIPEANTINHEFSPAYAFSPKHALAQYASTGCLNATFYASAETQLEMIIKLCEQVEPQFIAQTAIYCRQRGYMKDTPALLCAILSQKAPEFLPETFCQVMDNGKMVRNFVQIVRSGVIGRKSLGSLPKRLIVQWLDQQSDYRLFCASVGQSPSLADIIKMVHPKPLTQSRNALYGYLLGRDYVFDDLPESVKDFEAYKNKNTQRIPQIPFQFLTALDLGKSEWIEIAKNASWQMTRMNLNTFARHGVFEEKGMSELIAERLADVKAIHQAKVFPYQLMVAYSQIGKKVPSIIRNALQDAMEIALENIPTIKEQIYVCPDVSGSMTFSSVTGYRRGSSSVVRCIDIAALITAAILRNNPHTSVLPFEHQVVSLDLNSRDSVMTNTEKLASVGGGGTNCSAPLAFLNRLNKKGDLVIFISDNESWLGACHAGGTQMMREWNRFKERNPQAKLVCIDIQPYRTTQAIEQEDILNIGGFSDQVFQVVVDFAKGALASDHWVGEIESISLE